VKRSHTPWFAAAALLFSLASSACATLVRAPVEVEAERLLPQGAVAYARLDSFTLAQALMLVSGNDRKAVEAISGRTDSMTAAVVRQAGTSELGLLAVAEGRYPAGAASISLASDKAWKRSGPVWERKDGSMRLAFTDGDKAFFGTGSIDTLVAAASQPNPNPIPARWAKEWSAAVAVYLPDPMALLSGRVPIGDGAVPMVAMVLSALPVRSDSYEASMYFEFETERAAVVFSPLCRVFLYAAAHAMWPERAATVLDTAVWTITGKTVTAARLPLDSASLAAFLGAAGHFD
jgi:hypothetical protein